VAETKKETKRRKKEPQKYEKKPQVSGGVFFSGGRQSG
jgi:hypothetical protein